MVVEYKRMQQIRGTSEQWVIDDIIPLDGEITIERAADGNRLKVGDGVTQYSALPYVIPRPIITSKGSINAVTDVPPGGAPGDMWVNTGTGNVALGWGPPAAGTAIVPGDQLLMGDTHEWGVIPTGEDLSGYAKKSELAAFGSAAMIGTAAGSNVQVELDARPSFTDLTDPASASQIASTGPSNVQADINARPTSSSLLLATGAEKIGWQAPGSGSVLRTLDSKMDERGVSITDFGAVGNSNGTPGNGADCTAAINAAINSGVRDIFVPPLLNTLYRVTGPINIPRGIRFYGAGVVPYVGALGTRGPGSWIYFDHTGEGILHYNGGAEFSGGEITGIGLVRNQPVSALGWAPAANNWDINVSGSDCFIDNVCFWNATHALRHDFAGYGRLRVGYIYGSPFSTGLQVDRCYDLMHVSKVHWWPFPAIDNNYSAYTLANRKDANFLHTDGCFIDEFFCIGGSGLYFGIGADGQPPRAVNIDRLYTDLTGRWSIYVDASADGGSFTVNQLVAQGAVAADNNPPGANAGIVIAADQFVAKILSGSIGRFNQQIGIVTGAGSSLYMGAMTFYDYNQTGGSTALAVTGAGSKIVVSDPITLLSGGGGQPLIDGSPRISSKEFVDYNPAPSSTGGTLGGGQTCNVQRNREGGKVFINLRIQIPNNGSGSGSISVPLDIPGRSSRVFTIHGQEHGVSGKALIGRISGSTMLVNAYDNSYPASSGAILSLTGTYEADPI